MLFEAGLIPEGLSTRLQQMARFRNLLVHIYWKLDYGRIYDIMQRDTGDLGVRVCDSRARLRSGRASP